MRLHVWLLVSIIFLVVILASCAPAAQAPRVEDTAVPIVKTEAVEVEKEVTGVLQTSVPPAQPAPGSQAPTFPPPIPTIEKAAEPVQQLPTQVQLPIATEALFLATSTPEPTLRIPTASPPEYPPAAPTPTYPAVAHLVQVEWPMQMRLGESDITRLSLVPTGQGYAIVTEYPEHQVITQTVTIKQVSGYELFAVARLDGVGFEIAPAGDQAQYLPPDQKVEWRWSLTPVQAGNQRLAINLTLRWVPVNGTTTPTREVVIFSRALDVRVLSFLGLTQSQALFTGFITLLFGSGFSVIAFVFRPHSKRTSSLLEEQSPNLDLAIELPAGLRIDDNEQMLFQALFQRYHRLVIQQEFLSGYSGARTFLVLPVRNDGRTDAYTIAKFGESSAIQREYRNYETFVKDTLPPITARIQRPPVIIGNSRKPRLAGLQYTFIGEPGHPPISLRQAFLSGADASILGRLFETFGPNWWLQKSPFSFRLALEYDRVLPTHLIIEPAAGKGRILDGRQPPPEVNLHPGDIITLRNFPNSELRQDGASLSLQGQPPPGQPRLRVRWLSKMPPEGASGRVVEVRAGLLRNYVNGLELFGLPDPLELLPEMLEKTVQGSRSIIHGDLNLENIMVGPGGMLWLIDFAQTREGHTLFDFAHLGAEVIAHVIAPQVPDPRQYLDLLQGQEIPKLNPLNTLLAELEQISSRCLFNPSYRDEYRLALAISCLGALKYTNLSQHDRHLLYLTAAHLI